MWLDEKFAVCKQSTKLLFLYLITNVHLSLSRYTHLNDRQIMFDTGLNSVQLEESKKELEQLRWIFFKDGWYFHNHKCAYIDYVRNEKVATAKEGEINQVPSELAHYFNEICLNGVETPLEHRSNLNHKPETINNNINNNLESVKTFKKVEKYSSIKDIEAIDVLEIAAHYQVPEAFVQSKLDDMKNWLEANGRRYKNYRAALMNWVKKDALKIIDDERKTVNKFSVTKL